MLSLTSQRGRQAECTTWRVGDACNIIWNCLLPVVWARPYEGKDTLRILPKRCFAGSKFLLPHDIWCHVWQEPSLGAPECESCVKKCNRRRVAVIGHTGLVVWAAASLMTVLSNGRLWHRAAAMPSSTSLLWLSMSATSLLLLPFAFPAGRQSLSGILCFLPVHLLTTGLLPAYHCCCLLFLCTSTVGVRSLFSDRGSFPDKLIVTHLW